MICGSFETRQTTLNRSKIWRGISSNPNSFEWFISFKFKLKRFKNIRMERHSNVRYCSLDINNVEGYSDIKFRSSNVSENLGQLCNWRSEGGGCCFCFVLFIICYGYPQNYGYLSRSKPKVWHISSWLVDEIGCVEADVHSLFPAWICLSDTDTWSESKHSWGLARNFCPVCHMSTSFSFAVYFAL